MATVTLQDMLAARERRAAMREAMRAAHPGVCVSLSLNIPGPEKLSPRVRALFQHAVARVWEEFQVRAMNSLVEAAGPCAVFAVEDGAADAKRVAVRLEGVTGYGRLLDLDVYDALGAPVGSPERESGRPCFLCARPAAVCMRDQRHPTREIADAVDALFADFHAAMSRHISPAAEACAALGLEALLHEAAACPAPGLVDPLHTGSHKDMDFFTFQSGSAALAHGLARCAEAGIRHAGPPAALLPVLRRIGLEAEQRMFRATGGVNTQKGALFSMGLVLGASGLALRDGEPLTPENICGMAGRMAAGLVQRELGSGEPKSAGEKAYQQYGISGIRGEMEQGLPSVLAHGLPALEAALARGEERNRALIRALLALMAHVDDTTIPHRAGSLEALHEVRHKARALLDSGRLDGAVREDWQNAVWELDTELVRRNISPGGSADLLAVSWYLHRARGLGAWVFRP